MHEVDVICGIFPPDSSAFVINVLLGFRLLRTERIHVPFPYIYS